MHIPDGMLEARTWIPAWLGSAGTLAWALRHVRRTLTDGSIVMMAVMAALIFALQMLNFPVVGGTSGHFAGGAAAAIILGLWPAMVVMAAVVTVQAVFFADGGITALGANMLTMAIIGPLVGSFVYRMLSRVRATQTTRLVAAFVAAWTACVASATAAGVLLWLSGRAPLGAAVGAMAFWHALIGIGEGAITAGLVRYLLAVRPDLLNAGAGTPPDVRTSRKTAISLGVLALLAAGASFLAASSPDGLERAYRQVGAALGAPAKALSPLAGYTLPGITGDALAGVLAGLIGVVVTGALAYALLTAVRERKTRGGGQ